MSDDNIMFDSKLLNLVSDYWDIAWAEGRENRHHDTEDGAGQKTWMAIQKEVEELERYKAAFDFIQTHAGTIEVEAIPLRDNEGFWTDQITYYYSHHCGSGEGGSLLDCVEQAMKV